MHTILHVHVVSKLSDIHNYIICLSTENSCTCSGVLQSCSAAAVSHLKLVATCSTTTNIGGTSQVGVYSLTQFMIVGQALGEVSGTYALLSPAVDTPLVLIL